MTGLGAAPTPSQISAALVTLGLDHDATDDDVRTAWRTAIVAAHPDAADPDARDAAERSSARINAAKAVLDDPRVELPLASASSTPTASTADRLAARTPPVDSEAGPPAPARPTRRHRWGTVVVAGAGCALVLVAAIGSRGDSPKAPADAAPPAVTHTAPRRSAEVRAGVMGVLTERLAVVGPFDGQPSATPQDAVAAILRAVETDAGPAFAATLDPSWRRSDIVDLVTRLAAVDDDANLSLARRALTCTPQQDPALAVCSAGSGVVLPAGVEVRHRRDGWRVVGWDSTHPPIVD